MIARSRYDPEKIVLEWTDLSGAGVGQDNRGASS
jgi:hypothetical protein